MPKGAKDSDAQTEFEAKLTELIEAQRFEEAYRLIIETLGPGVNESARRADGKTTESPPPPNPKQVLDRLQGKFSREPPDPSWSGRAEQLARDQIRRVLPDSNAAGSIECRKSACRIELIGEDTKQQAEILRTITGAPGGPRPGDGILSGAAYSFVEEDGRSGMPVIVSYLFREGVSPPGPHDLEGP